MTPGKGLNARIAGDPERQARLRLLIIGKGPHAQRLLEAEALSEQQQIASRYTSEPERVA